MVTKSVWGRGGVGWDGLGIGGGGGGGGLISALYHLIPMILLGK